MAIPSTGTPQFDSNDPGVVNVEAQAYPFAPNVAQSLATNLGALLPGLTFAPPAVPVPTQALAVATPAFVESQPFVPLPLSLGTPTANVPSVNVSVQNVVRQPAADFVVTESGNFQFNAPVPTTVNRTILNVTSFTQVIDGVTTTFFVIRFVNGSNLQDFGVDLTGSEAAFPNSAPVRAPQDIPTGTITSWSNLQIVVDGTDLLGDPPVGGDVVTLDVTRHGSDVIFDLFPNDVDVLIAPAPPVAVTTVAAITGTLVNVLANDGVVTPFVGSGARIPLLLYVNLRETAFFPASQPVSTLGLPANVNVF